MRTIITRAALLMVSMVFAFLFSSKSLACGAMGAQRSMDGGGAVTKNSSDTKSLYSSNQSNVSRNSSEGSNARKSPDRLNASAGGGAKRPDRLAAGASGGASAGTLRPYFENMRRRRNADTSATNANSQQVRNPDTIINTTPVADVAQPTERKSDTAATTTASLKPASFDAYMNANSATLGKGTVQQTAFDVPATGQTGYREASINSRAPSSTSLGGSEAAR